MPATAYTVLTQLKNMTKDSQPNKKLTKTIVDAIPHPESGQCLYWDSELRGFGVRVTPGSKVYIVQKRVKGKTKRVKLGEHGVLTPDEARKEAIRHIAEMNKGEDPNQRKKEERARAKTLEDVWSDYKEERKLRPATQYLYEGALYRRCFKDWLSLPVTSITKDMVQKRHQKLTKSPGPRSNKEGAEAHANQAMRILRSLLNYAANAYEDSSGKPILPENPVKRLSQTKSWNKNKRRKTHIVKSDLKPWYQAVKELKHDTMRDFLILCLFTGLRRNEAASLRWENLNLEESYMWISEDVAKNHEEHRLPLPGHLVKMLKERKKKYFGKGVYVFPSQKDPTKHMTECKFSVKTVCETSGVKFMVHDLRRTFLTIGESLDLSHYALKRLANHKMSADVTAGYVVPNVERLRAPMEQISEFILEAVGEQPDKQQKQPISKGTRTTDTYQRLQSL